MIVRLLFVHELSICGRVVSLSSLLLFALRVAWQLDLTMDAVSNVRVTWQFYTESFLWRDAFKGRSFAVDRLMFDHFNIAPSEVTTRGTESLLYLLSGSRFRIVVDRGSRV